jgi:hypothetical protein
MEYKMIKVTDYTRDPFGRYPTDGKGNGESFRKLFLVPPLKEGKNIKINLDGIKGEYNSSFIDEAFANLIRMEDFSYKFIKKHVSFVSIHPEWIEEIDEYIEDTQTPHEY